MAALIFGAAAPFALNGQQFTNDLFGIICGFTTAVCGLALRRTNEANAAERRDGLVMAVLGIVLALALLPQLPSAYRSQAQFNQLLDDIQQNRIHRLEVR